MECPLKWQVGCGCLGPWALPQQWDAEDVGRGLLTGGPARGPWSAQHRGSLQCGVARLLFFFFEVYRNVIHLCVNVCCYSVTRLCLILCNPSD